MTKDNWPLTDPSKAYNQDSATVFIRLNALRLRVAAKVRKAGG